MLGWNPSTPPLKVNIYTIINIREVGSVATGQAILKARKLSPKGKPRLTRTSPNTKNDKEINSIIYDEATAKTLSKKTLIKSAIAFKNKPLNIFSFLVGTPAELRKKICHCLDQKLP